MVDWHYLKVKAKIPGLSSVSQRSFREFPFWLRVEFFLLPSVKWRGSLRVFNWTYNVWSKWSYLKTVSSQGEIPEPFSSRPVTGECANLKLSARILSIVIPVSIYGKVIQICSDWVMQCGVIFWESADPFLLPVSAWRGVIIRVSIINQWTSGSDIAFACRLLLICFYSCKYSHYYPINAQ